MNHDVLRTNQDQCRHNFSIGCWRIYTKLDLTSHPRDDIEFGPQFKRIAEANLITYSFQAQAPDNLTLQRGDVLYTDLSNQV